MTALDTAIPLLELLERLVEVFQQPAQTARPVRLRDARALSRPAAAPAAQLIDQAEAALQGLRKPFVGRQVAGGDWRHCALVLPVNVNGEALLLPLRIGHQTERENRFDQWSLEFILAPPDAPDRLEFSLRLRATELSLQALCGQQRKASDLQDALREWASGLTRAGLQVDFWIAGLDARP